MKATPVLGDWEIPRIALIRTLERRMYVEQEVPGRTASLYQDLNTAPTRIVIAGSLFGDEDRDEFLTEVRGKFQAGEPVTFVADIVTATKVQHVVIETLEFQESGATPDQIDYMVVLRESPPPPPPADPFGAIDAGLLAEAGGYLDSVSGALDVVDTLAGALDALGNVPDFADPTPPLKTALESVTSATAGLDGALQPLRDLLGSDEA